MPAQASHYSMATAGLLVFLIAFPFKIAGQSGAGRQDPDDVIRVYTELVQTDVMVFDKRGSFVDKLRKEDFELKVDGKVRPIEFFDRVRAGSIDEERQLKAARGAPSSAAQETEAPVPLDRGRTIFFYIDDLHLAQSSVTAARKLINGFIAKEMSQNDEVAITSASGQIGFLQQLTDNKTVLRTAVERLKARPYSVRDFDRPPMTEYQALLLDRENGEVRDYFVQEFMRQNPMTSRAQAEAFVKARAHGILNQASTITRNTLIGLEGLVKTSRKLPGRKLVFFISDGFLLDFRNSDSSDWLQRITGDAARNGVVIYSLDSRGLVASLSDASGEVAFDPSGRLERASHGELQATQDPLNALARDTGGRAVFNTNSLEAGLSRSLEETSTYYLLAWKPDPQVSNKFHRIEVRLLSRPDLTVRVRRGFYDSEPVSNNKVAKKEPAAKTPQIQLREAIGAPYPELGFPVALSLNYVNTVGQKMLLSATLKIPSELISFSSEAGKHKGTVQVAGSVFNDKGQAGAQFEEQITVTAASMTSINEGKESVTYTYPITVESGLYQVRVAVRDDKTGRTGSANAWIEVPDLSDRKLRLSSLIIGDKREEITNASSTDQQAAPIELSIDHQFARNSVLRFLFIVYNAARAPNDSLPDVASQLQVLRDNQPVLTTALRKISTLGVDPDRLPYAADLSLEGLPAGQYVLRVTCIDRVSKTSASQQTRFAIN